MRLHTHCSCGYQKANGNRDGCSCYDEVPKLFDFGLAKELKSKYRDHGPHDDEGTYKLTARSGTRRYMAPEVALSQPYNEKVDVYSLGVMLYQVASLVAPFGGYSLLRHEEEVLRGGNRPNLESPSSRRVASLLTNRDGITYERWLAEGSEWRKDDWLQLRTKCVWTRELRSLIRDCWRGDMRLRPRMRDVVTRLECCIQELTSIKRDVSNGMEGDKARMTSRRPSKRVQPL
jgi:serine/threonine protein kinase